MASTSTIISCWCYEEKINDRLRESSTGQVHPSAWGVKLLFLESVERAWGDEDCSSYTVSYIYILYLISYTYIYIYIRTYIFREQDMQRFQVFHSVSFWGYFNSSFYLLQDGYKKCVYTLFIINHHHFQGLDMGETLHATWLVFWGFAQRPRPSGWAPAPSSWFWRFWLHPGLFGSVGHRRLWELWAQQPGAAWSLPIDRSPLTLQET